MIQSNGMQKKKILVLLRNHFTHDARVERETRALHQNGYNVTTFCLGNDRLDKREDGDGGTIDRIVNVSAESGRRIYIKIWVLLMFALITLWRGRNFDAVHCNDLDMLPIGVLLKAITFGRMKVVYDSHEYQVEQNNKAKWIKPILKPAEAFFIKFVDHVITVSDSIADEYKKLYNIEKPSVILNCPPYSNVSKKKHFHSKFKLNDSDIIFLYQGGFSLNRGIENILESFSRLKDPQKVVVFMGYGVLEAQIKDYAHRHKNIYFHEAVGQDILAEYTASADVGILTYKNTCLNHYYCSPNKFFEYTMASLPVIVSNLYDLSRLTKKHDNGFILAENTANDLLSTIKSITPDLIASKRKNTAPMKKEFCWENQEKILLNIYKKLDYK